MKVSVIVPVYNTENYLEECLNSLVNQSLGDMEILVVDDGSTDGSLKIAREFEKNYPDKLTVLTKTNGGLSSARNWALPYTKGEYVGFVDSDDWVDTTMYEEMYSAAIRENADIVICDMQDHYPTRVLYHHSSQFESKFKVTPSACNKIFRKSMVGTDMFPLGLWYEDFEFTTKQLMKTENIAVIHKPFYHCHCREGSIMNNNKSLKNLDILTVLEHIEQFMQQNNLEQKYGDVLEYLYLDHVLITAINRVEAQTSKEKREVIRKMREAVVGKYPNFRSGEVLRAMPRNRRIVALLNGAGLSVLSRKLLELKSRVK